VLCHQTEAGGDHTVTRPFGRTMMELGARGNGDLGSLRAALRGAREADSDGDGVGDVEELLDGARDPNRPEIELPDGGGVVLGDAPEELPTLQTGCAMGTPGAGGSVRGRHGLVVLVLAGVTVWLRRRIGRALRLNGPSREPSHATSQQGVMP
jgi:hypothetical protein